MLKGYFSEILFNSLINQLLGASNVKIRPNENST